MKRNLVKIALFVLFLPIGGCEKELMDYKGIEGVYFAVQSGSSWGSEVTWPYQPFTNVEFVKIPEDQTTVNIKVMITGPEKDYDRPFSVEINPDSTTATLGVHYEPLPQGLYIPAHSVVAYVPVTLKRASDLANEQKTVGLRLVANENFGLSFPEWDALPGYTATSGAIVQEFDASLHSIRINDFMVKPKVWIGSVQEGNRESGSWGAFSSKKIKLMCTIMHLTYADFSSTTTMPTVLSSLLTSECAKYLIAQYNAGTPVLEDDGRLMFIGSVPWTSYIGVPWVPSK